MNHVHVHGNMNNHVATSITTSGSLIAHTWSTHFQARYRRTFQLQVGYESYRPEFAVLERYGVVGICDPVAVRDAIFLRDGSA